MVSNMHETPQSMKNKPKRNLTSNEIEESQGKIDYKKAKLMDEYNECCAIQNEQRKWSNQMAAKQKNGLKEFYNFKVLYASSFSDNESSAKADNNKKRAALSIKDSSMYETFNPKQTKEDQEDEQVMC